jgi:hypothetical protein
MSIRQPDYFERDSPAIQGTQYFVIPPPGLLEIKAKNVSDMLRHLPRKPRSKILIKEIEEQQRFDDARMEMEKTQRLQLSLRRNLIDDSRKEAEKMEMEKTKLGRMSGLETTTPRSLGGASITGAVGMRFSDVKSPITFDGRSFLSEWDLTHNANVPKSAAERKTMAKVGQAKERLARGEVIAPPKTPKRSKKRPNFRAVSAGDGSSRERERSTSPSVDREREREETEKRQKAEKRFAVSLFLSLIPARLYLTRLRNIAHLELIANRVRENNTVLLFYMRAQVRIRRRLRRSFLFRVWHSRVRIVRAVSRWSRRRSVCIRNDSLDRVKTFLLDVREQCWWAVKARMYRRCVIKAQRAARDFLVCTRAKRRLLMLQIAKLIKKVPDPSMTEHLRHGLDVLKLSTGMHLLTELLVRARVVYSRLREDMRRRKRENDTTPGFTELDLWQCKEYLFSGQEDNGGGEDCGSKTKTLLPPQYRGKIGLDFTQCSLTLFSRKHIVQELLDVVKTAASINITAEQIAALRLSKNPKRQVKIKDLPKVFIPKQRRRRKNQKNSEETEDKDPSKAALALISVIEGRIKMLKKTSLVPEEGYEEEEDEEVDEVEKSE